MTDQQKVGIGVGVMILKDKKILLGQRHFDPEKADSELHGEGTWTMPGGKVHFGEDLEETCQREVCEETGLKVDKNKLKLISVSNDKVEDAHFITLGFLLEEFEGEPKVMEPDEITKWRWFNLDDLPENMFFCSSIILKHFLSKKIY